MTGEAGSQPPYEPEVFDRLVGLYSPKCTRPRLCPRIEGRVALTAAQVFNSEMTLEEAVADRGADASRKANNCSGVTADFLRNQTTCRNDASVHQTRWSTQNP